MCVKTFYRFLRPITYFVLFFFCWSYMELFMIPTAIAAQQKTEAGTQTIEDSRRLQSVEGQKPEERFERLLDDIRETVGKAGDKAAKGENASLELEMIKSRKAEIANLRDELNKEFDATAKRLRDGKLPSVIISRHEKFVESFERNYKELQDALNSVQQAKTKNEKQQAYQKARAFLESVRPKSRHQKLDPENMPFKARKAAKWREPRLKKEEFKEFGTQKNKNTLRTALIGHKDAQKAQEVSGGDIYSELSLSSNVPVGATLNSRLKASPILLAYNDIASDAPFTLPRPIVGEGGGEGAIPQIAFSDPILNIESGMLNLAQAVDAPAAADLAENGIDVQFADAIKVKAQELGYSPVKIYEWVRNNIEYIPTYGSIQGADMCLQTKQCNDFDTASLLIALLRVSGIPARYVYGTVEISIDKIKNWTGGFSDSTAALTLMASGGIPVAAGMSGGAITKARFEHTWVETYIPYGNYRGSMRDDSLRTWIPMDGSYKEFTYTNGFDVTGAVPFNQDEYLSQVQSQNAVHYYQSKIQAYLDVNMPDKSIIDVKGYREIKQEKYPFLPSTLSYKVMTLGGKFSSIPANMQATATFTLSNPSTGSNISYMASLPELAGKRITVSYIPATPDDEALIAKYGGFLYDVPAYMLNLRAILRVEGVIKLTSDVTTLGSEQGLTMQFSQPNGNSETVNKMLIAGAYYAVGLDTQGINENVLGKRNYQLNTNVLTQTAGTLGNDDLIGEYLYIRAITYFLANNKLYKGAAKLYNTAMMRAISEGITSTPLKVSYVFSIPKTATPSGVEIDVAMDRIVAVAKDGNVNKEKAFMNISGLVSSYDEHDVFEKLDEFPSVSAVRALQIAATNGISIYTINSANIAQVLPTIQVDQEVRKDIQNAVNAGKEVTISQTNVRIGDWLGVGYIVKDPISGSGAYRISGGLGGALSTAVFVGVAIVALYKGPYGWIKDQLDPQTRRNIVTAAELEVGNMIIGITEQIVDMSYDTVDCSHLVRIAYWAAGICLDDGVGSDCTRNNLVRKHHVPGTGGASYFFNLADHIKFNNSIRQSNDPLIGDMVFFRYGTRIGHVGIVISVPNDRGTIQIIDSTGSRGVDYRKMNINLINCDENWPPLTRRTSTDPPAPTCCTSCTAGNLFSGFGTVRDVPCDDISHQ